MSKLFNVKDCPISERKYKKSLLIEFMNKNQNNILSMSPKTIMNKSGIEGMSQTTIYRTIKAYKQELIKSSSKRLCSQLVNLDN